jgi:drug/metabolite transporter (DMT)-like permease
MPTIAALGLSLVLWASAFAGIRIALTGFSPAGLTLTRLLVGSVTLGIYAVLVRVRLPRARHIPVLVLMGGLGIGLYQVALNAGERTVNAGTASLLIASAPLFTAALASLFLHERLAPTALVGIILGFAGTATIAFASGRVGLHLSIAALVILVAALAESVYFVMQKSLFRTYGAAEVGIYTVWGATIASLIFLPATLSDAQRSGTVATVAALYLGVFPSAVAYVAWSWALGRIPASMAASTLYLLPVLAIAIAWFSLREVPSPVAIAGGVVTILGVILVNSRRADTT